MTVAVLGAVKGRHPLPVKNYIFTDTIADPTNVEAIHQHVTDTLDAIAASELVLYVTGLTIVTTAVIKYCIETNTELTLMHFNAATGDYFQQVII